MLALDHCDAPMRSDTLGQSTAVQPVVTKISAAYGAKSWPKPGYNESVCYATKLSEKIRGLETTTSNGVSRKDCKTEFKTWICGALHACYYLILKIRKSRRKIEDLSSLPLLSLTLSLYLSLSLSLFLSLSCRYKQTVLN